MIELRVLVGWLVSNELSIVRINVSLEPISTASNSTSFKPMLLETMKLFSRAIHCLMFAQFVTQPRSACGTDMLYYV